MAKLIKQPTFRQVIYAAFNVLAYGAEDVSPSTAAKLMWPLRAANAPMDAQEEDDTPEWARKLRRFQAHDVRNQAVRVLANVGIDRLEDTPRQQTTEQIWRELDALLYRHVGGTRPHDAYQFPGLGEPLRREFARGS